MTKSEKCYENYQLCKGCETFDFGLLRAPYPRFTGSPFEKRED